MELENEIFEEISELCEDGEYLIEDNEFLPAIEIFNKALSLVPEPKTDWEASTWLYTAIGDTYAMVQDYKNGLSNLQEAQKCLGGEENPFILFKMGQCLFELGETEQGTKLLLQSYKLDGADIFEDEDEKYLVLIKDLI